MLPKLMERVAAWNEAGFLPANDRWDGCTMTVLGLELKKPLLAVVAASSALTSGCDAGPAGPTIAEPEQLRLRIESGSGQTVAATADRFPEPIIAQVTVEGEPPSEQLELPANTQVTFSVADSATCGSPAKSFDIPDAAGYVESAWEITNVAGKCVMELRIVTGGVPRDGQDVSGNIEPGPLHSLALRDVGRTHVGAQVRIDSLVKGAQDEYGNDIPLPEVFALEASHSWDVAEPRVWQDGWQTSVADTAGRESFREPYTVFSEDDPSFVAVLDTAEMPASVDIFTQFDLLVDTTTSGVNEQVQLYTKRRGAGWVQTAQIGAHNEGEWDDRQLYATMSRAILAPDTMVGLHKTHDYIQVSNAVAFWTGGSARSDTVPMTPGGGGEAVRYFAAEYRLQLHVRVGESGAGTSEAEVLRCANGQMPEPGEFCSYLTH